MNSQGLKPQVEKPLPCQSPSVINNNNRIQTSIAPGTFGYKKFSQNPIDSLRSMLDSDNSDSIKIDAFSIHSNQHSEKPETVLRLISEMLNYVEKMNDVKTRALCYRKIGAIYSMQNYFDKVLECTFKATNLCEKINDKKGLASCYNNIGNAYNNKGDLTKDPLFFDRSIDYHHRCIKLLVEINDTLLLGNSYVNIGNAYLSKERKKTHRVYRNSRNPSDDV